MASLPWVPWPYPNRTEVLSPAQIERIVQMHRESKQNAVIYVLVVLALYFVALAILVGRYLQNERDLDVVVCLGQVLERCMATYRRGAAGPSAAPAPALGATPAGLPAAPPAASGPAARKFSLRMTWSGLPPLQPLPPPTIKVQKPRRPRPRPPQTDDESSDATPSPPYSPAEAPAPSSPSTDGDDVSRGAAMNTMNCLPWAAAGTAVSPGAARSMSPTVVSVMVCDLQDTQV